VKRTRTQTDRDLYNREVNERRPVKRVPRGFKKKAGGMDGFLSDLEGMRAYADKYRKPGGGKLTSRERNHFYLTGELPGSAIR